MHFVPVVLAMMLAVQSTQQPTQRGPVIMPDTIEGIDIRGNKLPSATIRNQIRTKQYDTFDQNIVDGDVKRLYAFQGGLFDDIQVQEEKGSRGGIILVFHFVEKKRIDRIEYLGLKSFTKSDVGDKLREKKINLGKETKFDPTIAAHAMSMIKVLLAEKGHQDATIEYYTEKVTENSIALTFRINEGPKIRIQHIEILGNTTFSDKTLLNEMKLVKPAGPLTPFTGKDTYHALKLGDDITRIRMFYSDRGFIRVNIVDPTVETKPVTLWNTFPFWKPLPPWGIPISKKTVNRLFLGIHIEENDPYRISSVKVLGVATPQQEELVKVFLGFKPGDLYSEGQLRKGFENLKKFYGGGGYINFNPDPQFEFDDANKTIDLTINIETGKQYSIHRISFYGNTTTRDKVIRRELGLVEGNLFNSNELQNDILRINQLGFFDEIKTEDAHVDPNEKDSTVDVNIKVTEKGKNTIGLSGGASAVGGSFIGVNYATNNFFGFGETVSVDLQAGTRQSNFITSFTEPYFRDRPLSLGFSVQASTYHYDQARDTYGLDPNHLPTGLGFEQRLNYDQRQNGFSVYSSYPLRLFRRFARVGISYQFSNSQTNSVNAATEAYFHAVLAQQGETFVSPVGSGFSTFKARKITPTFLYSTVDSPNFPTGGKSITMSLDFTGGPLGGNVNLIRPVTELRYYKSMTKRRNVFASRLMASYVRGFNGLTVPFYERYQIGGEYDIRGFENRVLSPISFVTQFLDSVDPETGGTAKRPFDDIAYVGGDAQAVLNLEYRIRIMGPVTMSPFFDIGNTWTVRKEELTRKFLDSNGNVTTETAHFLPGTNSGFRSSTGVEVGVVLPMFNVPFRVIFGYNLLRLNDVAVGPTTGLPFQLKQPGRIVKFSIGRTF